MKIERQVSTRDAAGIAFVSPDGLALFLRRSAGGDHSGTWCLPGGEREEDETLEEAARREALEEVGIDYAGPLAEVAGTLIGDGPGVYTTFLARLPAGVSFDPTINDESEDFAWRPLNDPPQPLHPGLSEGLAGGRVAADGANNTTNQGIYHLANRPGGEAKCGNRRAMMTVGRERFGALSESNRCQRCEVTFQKWETMRTKREGAHDAEFKEGDHPRDDDGKFGSGGGSSGGGSEGAEGSEESAPEGSEQEAKEQRELVQSFYEESPGDVVDVINAANLKEEVSAKIDNLYSATSDLADTVESLEEDVAAITEEDRKGLKEGEVFTAEEDLEEQSIEAAGQASVAREELVEVANALAGVLGIDDIAVPEGFELDNMDAFTGKEARAVHDAIAAIDIDNRYMEVDDAASDLENAMDDDDEEWDNTVEYAKVYQKKATELHEAVKVAIYQLDVATEPARKRFEEAARKQTEEDYKRLQSRGQDKAIAGDACLAFDRAIFTTSGVEMLRPGLAFDRGSVRNYDVDGRLRIEVANISKANICPYLGHEIPGWEELGLEKAKIYHLFRDPEELEKAAPSFNNLPLLSKHVAVTADDHQPDLVIGATGSNATFSAPFLRNSLVVWAKNAIGGIEQDDKKELSSAYHYRADMTAGTYQGARYDGVMRDILGNHVALVKEGRAGTDVVVGDSKEHVTMATKTKTTIRTVLTIGAVSAFLQPRLKKDAGAITFDHALDGLTSTNFSARKPSILAAVKKATLGKLAHDASVDGLEAVLNMLEGGKGGSADADPAADPIPMKDAGKADNPDGPGIDADVPGFLKGKLTEDDYKTCMDMMSKGAAAKDKDPKLEELGAAGDAEKDDPEKKDDDAAGKDAAGPDAFKGKPEVGAKAMDERIASAVKVATDSAIKVQRGIREAESAVRPWVGELTVAFDSAEAVYRHALTMLGVDHAAVHATALRHILDVQPRPGRSAATPSVAMDAAASDDFAKRFPEAARLRQ